ncbi:unnamed protein product [Closterium sp. NIES-65]|nr:unnamed protein product [Closterium sp. NIES-65]
MPSLAIPSCSDLSHNYLTGPLVKLPAIQVDLSNNYLSGAVSGPDCLRYTIAANCFTQNKACRPESQQRPAAQCSAFCGISNTTAACGGRGLVNFTFALMPQPGFTAPSSFAFVIAAKAKAGAAARVGYGGAGSGSIAVVFNMDGSNQQVGLSINGGEEPLVSEPSTFTLTDGYAYKVWVDYEPGDPGTEGRIRVFLAGADGKPVEPLLQERLSLCAVLQGGVKQQAFSFGFTVSTAVMPFQLHGILFSSVQTGKDIKTWGEGDGLPA